MSDLVTSLLTEHPLVVGALVFPFILYVFSSLLAPTFDYKNKHVMITGGSSGIGLEVNTEGLYTIIITSSHQVAVFSIQLIQIYFM
jgi:hypothetical protein